MENTQENVMARFRVPKDIYDILSIEAIKRRKKPTQFMVSILMATAEKIKERDEQFKQEWGG